MSRKKSWIYRGPSHTTFDRALVQRAEYLHANYPLLRLCLTRFAWCKNGVESRARNKILEWVETQLKNITADATALALKPERYFRNLLSVLPSWIQELLCAAVLADERCQVLLGHLDLKSLSTQEPSKRFEVLQSLLRSPNPVALSPDEVLLVAPIKGQTLQRARERWYSSHPLNIPGSIERALASPAASTAQPDLPLTADQLLLVEQPPLPHLLPFGWNSNGFAPVARAWLALERELTMGMLTEATTIGFLNVVSKHRHYINWANGCLAQALRQMKRLPRQAHAFLREDISSWNLMPALTTLRVVGAGRKHALHELSQLSPALVEETISHLHKNVRRRIALSLLSSTTPDWQIDGHVALDRPKSVRAIPFYLLTELPARLLPALIARWKRLGPGLWRERLVSRVHLMNGQEIHSFLQHGRPLDRHWNAVPLKIKEALREAWLQNHRRVKPLAVVAANTCPSFALDVARSANDKGSSGGSYSEPRVRPCLGLDEEVRR